MRYTFELYILTDQLTPAHWTKFYQAVRQYNGLLGKFELTVGLSDNIVRFFVHSTKDLSALSNNTEGLLLQPVDAGEMQLPTSYAKERLVQFVAGGNLLDLKEKYALKKALPKSLECSPLFRNMSRLWLNGGYESRATGSARTWHSV